MPKTHKLSTNDAEIKVGQELLEFMDGLLLGDGSYRNRKGYSSFSMSQSIKSEEWIKHIAIGFDGFGVQYHIGYGNYDGHKYVYLQTYRYTFFEEHEKRWYFHFGGKRVKVVPKDIQLTPTVLLNWFLGDGCSWWKRGSGQVGVSFSTQSFNYDDNIDLITKLNHLGFHGFKIQILKSGNCVMSTHRKDEIIRFFEYIGDSPVRCYDYKWKVPTCKHQRYKGQIRDRGHVIKCLMKIRDDIGHVPTLREVKKVDPGLCTGIYKYHGGYTNVINNMKQEGELHA